MARSSASGQSTAETDDVTLLDRAARGDESAFRALVERHARYLHGVARSLVGVGGSGGESDADDLVQETFAATLKAVRRFRGDASVRTWLVSILVRQAALTRRRQHRGGGTGRTLSLFRGASADTRGGSAGATRESEPADARSHIGGIDARMDLATMLQALSPEHREVILLREREGLSYDAIAETLGIPRGTVESRLFRAREELRKRFEGYLER